MFFMRLVPVLVIGVAVWLVFEASRTRAGSATFPAMPPQPPVLHESPREVLDLRYARGEIEREEHLARKADFGS